MTAKKTNILIVEDEISLQQALCDQCEREGFKVITAKNGREGLDIALEEHPDCILLDIMLPDMDGVTMLKELRKDEWGKDACVMTLTNLADGGTVEKSMRAGTSEFLIKSNWSMADLMSKLREVLENKK